MLVLEKDWRLVCVEKPRHTLLMIPDFLFFFAFSWNRDGRHGNKDTYPPSHKSTCDCEDLYKENPHPTVNYFLKRICTAAPLLASWFHSFAADINFKVYHCRIMIMRKSWEAATTTAFHLTIWPCCAWVIFWLSLAGKRPFYFELLRQQLQSTLAWFVKLCLETTEDVAGP